jgi:hypothetical protein
VRVDGIRPRRGRRGTGATAGTAAIRKSTLIARLGSAVRPGLASWATLVLPVVLLLAACNNGGGSGY